MNGGARIVGMKSDLNPDWPIFDGLTTIWAGKG